MKNQNWRADIIESFTDNLSASNQSYETLEAFFLYLVVE